MKFSILTLFPEFFDALRNYSIVGRAIEESKIEINTVNIRDFSENKHGQVDDYSYGGGPGMVMMAPPIYRAIKSVESENSRVIYLSPQGKTLTQKKLIELSKIEHLVLLNGHYEGIDNRIIENYVDEEISIGDYVLTGAEIPSMVLIDGITRLLPGVLSSDESYSIESHYNGILEYPQYTRPSSFNGYDVPEILLSGNHEKIKQYRIYEAIKVTLKKRPELLDRDKLSDYEKKILNDIEFEGR
ncbi:tRNA (guanosine(37)-N1)-methyltransferase TrmD [Peptoniphilus sp. oral taxon 386]|uniref:tRNA (guanosine(37)-N1)-methyltransferase TrmD n=1 Tax=Peptoniphilus sp. oral taxon 386 TaxID=652713 RepID=UPI0001DA9C75|nr:tRNA (guanosine(37)-N1)-methyltransferase TrmD [Peptoniphilus sp. oral taxon 386]EFI42231.1 tRNA (guanine-N(1)-)-methyltransferase [Peptoniphilus sp. oral taxon 386 str. F0131]